MAVVRLIGQLEEEYPHGLFSNGVDFQGCECAGVGVDAIGGQIARGLSTGKKEGAGGVYAEGPGCGLGGLLAQSGETAVFAGGVAGDAIVTPVGNVEVFP